MFSSLTQTDFFKNVAHQAQTTIIKDDRNQYYPIFDLVKQTLQSGEHDNTIFSDPAEITATSDTCLKTSMVIYTMYPRKIATELANIIHKKFAKFTQMRAIIPNEEYSVMYNMRGLITIYRIDKYKQIPLKQLFDAVSINSLLYFPEKVELIDVYHKLYLPNYNEEYSGLLEIENTLFKSAFSTKKKLGGAEIDDPCKPCKLKRQVDIYNLKILLLKMLHNENYVLVGEWAHQFINSPKYPETGSPIQIISENSIDHDYKTVMMYLSKFTKYGMFFKKKKIYIPKDNRICKYTIYVKFPIIGKHQSSIDKPFLDIYNCGSYELIPFVPITVDKLNLKVGNLYVQLRFLFIDMWLLELIKMLKEADTTDFKTKLKYIVDTIKKIKLIPKQLLKDSSEYFIGINYDNKIAQKIEISKKQLKKDSYYPEISIKQSKKYQLIASTS